MEMSSSTQNTSDSLPLAYLEHHNDYPDELLRSILMNARTMAFVGASGNWKRPSFFAMKYLLKKGYKIVPINPTRAGEVILGQTVLKHISEYPDKIDLVDIFRNSKDAFGITEEVIKFKVQKHIQYLWMQLSVRNDKAAELAEESGLTVVMNRCPKIEFARLSGELGWSGINTGLITSKPLKAPRS